VLGVSSDSPAANAAFRTKFGFPYDLLSDTDLAMSRAYGAASPGAGRASRVSVLIGTDGRVLRGYAEVKPGDHPAEVLADLAALD
jgi:peroxiredoxin Q/BCP